MSILNKKSLAAALLVGLGIAGSASAYTVTSAGFPIMVATADITDATTNIGINIPVTVTLTGDTILGRTTGFTIRYDLNNGATFGEVLDASDLAIGTAARFGMPGAWSASIAAGGGLADNFVVISMNPGAPADCDANPGTADAVCGLIDGTLLTIAPATSVLAPAATGQVLDSLTQLQQVGQEIQATISFTDPVTGNPIGGMGPTARIILRSGDPVNLSCDATDGNTTRRIDVGASNGQASKTFFSATGAIAANNADRINLGSISSAVNSGFNSFDYAPTDTFVTVLNGDFDAFNTGSGTRDIFLSSNSNCSTNNANGVFSNGNDTVTFTYTNSAVGGNIDGYTAYVCALVPAGNATVIEATPVTVVSTTFTRGTIVSNGSPSFANCSLLPLRYNGSVVDVYHINPAFNTTAQSFLRIINPNEAPGLVTITAIDDAGVAAPGGAVSFTLAPRSSKQLNSDTLEQGGLAGVTGAWGDGTGKWRAVVTGEFADMVVQSLNRNNNDGTVTNLTDADTRGEQVINNFFNDN